jgi:hypothetical protein
VNLTEELASSCKKLQDRQQNVQRLSEVAIRTQQRIDHTLQNGKEAFTAKQKLSKDTGAKKTVESPKASPQKRAAQQNIIDVAPVTKTRRPRRAPMVSYNELDEDTDDR